MPTYEYECRGCGRVFEVRQRISEAPLTTCEVCGGEVRRLLSPAPFILKGEGWYVTDYPSAARKKALESEKSSSTSTDAKPSGEKSSEKSSGEQSSTPAAPSTTAASPAPSSPSKAD